MGIFGTGAKYIGSKFDIFTHYPEICRIYTFIAVLFSMLLDLATNRVRLSLFLYLVHHTHLTHWYGISQAPLLSRCRYSVILSLP